MINKCRLAAIISFLIILSSFVPSQAQNGLGRIRRVCIDAGHGGKDGGAPGSRSHEKQVVLPVALKVGKLISRAYPSIQVIYVRNRDVFVELRERTRIANSNKADLFISIHANALDIKKNPRQKAIRGVETFVLGTHNTEHNLKVAMKENAVIHYEDDYSVKYQGFDPNRPESYIMFNMLRSIHMDKSLMLASLIQEELVKSTGMPDRDVRQAPLWVLKDVAMPSVLVEIGYMSNLQDERFMLSSSGQDRIARGIFEGFRKYKQKVEGRVDKDFIGQVEVQPSSGQVGRASSRGTDFASPVYMIQVASSVRRIRKPASILPGWKIHEIRSGGRYRYYVAPNRDLDVVKGHFRKVRLKVKDSFIAAVYRDEVITLSAARKLLK